MPMAVPLLLIVLFAMVFVFAYGWLSAGADWLLRHRRLELKREAERQRRPAGYLQRFGKLYVHLADLLGAAGWTKTAETLVLWSVLLACAGAVSGIVLFQSARPAALLGVMLGMMPYGWLRFRLVNRQMASRLDLLPALELFYQCYLITGRRQIRNSLQRMTLERKLPGEIQSVFEQLYRSLCVKGDDEGSLRRFAMAIGSVWADYFANMLGVALREGNDISANLKELIGDLRKARMDEQSERHRMLEIRLANFSPLLFLALFLGVNFRMNEEASYRSYVLDPAGRIMLLNAAVLIFASFLMGIYLSRRRL